MTDDDITLPMYGKGDKQQIEIRPAHVEEWLDSLPYIDFQYTCQILQAALQATNQVTMKPNQRLELIQLYNRPYQYYLESQISSATQHTLHGIETMQTQLEGMKGIAIELANSSRMAIDDVFSHKSMWGENKLPLGALLQAIKYFSHTLIFSFLQYTPPPENIWFQLNYLYKFAENLNKDKTLGDLGGDKKQSNNTTAEQLYKRILLVSLADPHHLPFGAAWEIYERLDDWTNKTQLRAFEKVTNPAGIFVINKDEDAGPVPYEKFDANKADKQHCIIDTNELIRIIYEHLNINDSTMADGDQLFSNYYTRSLLKIIYKAWSQPAKRYASREASTGKLWISHGLNATYYYLNKSRDFVDRSVRQGVEDIVLSSSTSNIMSTSASKHYELETWKLVDKSSGGLAILKHERPDASIRVGDLVGFSPKGKVNAEFGWVVGVLRWLLVKPDSSYQAGVQALSKKMLPGAICAPSGALQERTWSRALVADQPAKNKGIQIITNRIAYTDGKKLELEFKGVVYKGTATRLVESTTGYERFIFEC